MHIHKFIERNGGDHDTYRITEINGGEIQKVAKTKNSIVVGTVGDLTEENITYEVILHIARFYDINTKPGVFQYHFITADGAVKRGCKFPINNYNNFIEFFI